MDCERFRYVRDFLGYDNERLARALNIDLAEVEDFCLGRKPVPVKVADNLELHADWSMEVGDARSKKELEKNILANNPKDIIYHGQ
jgi:plasmid maintenance system antidote protein VapI